MAEGLPCGERGGCKMRGAGLGLSLSAPVSGMTIGVVPVEVEDMVDVDLKVYFLASLLATPTKIGSSSSVLSSTNIVSTSLPLALSLPFPLPFSNVGFFVLGFEGLEVPADTFRGILCGLREAVVVSMI